MSYKLIEYTATKFLSHSNSKQNTREETFIYEQTVVSFFSIINNNIIIKLNEFMGVILRCTVHRFVWNHCISNDF